LKNTCKLFIALPLLAAMSAGQNAPAGPAARTDLYHVHFAKAAVGKGAAEGDYLKKQDSTAAMPGHYLVLRHQEGEDWDYAVIEHLGTKTTVDAAGTPPPAAARDLGAWHTDTFVNGPAWPAFARAMGIDESSAGKTAGSVYVVSFIAPLRGIGTNSRKCSLKHPTKRPVGTSSCSTLRAAPGPI
jgi:hypothetical protein